MRPGARAIVKPMVELMAALPSVVVGFLAGLWLAPLLERRMVATLLFPVLGGVVMGLAGIGVYLLPRRGAGAAAAWGGVLRSGAAGRFGVFVKSRPGEGEWSAPCSAATLPFG
ncbi:MAG: hypothetical protein KatS3mg115_1651 [Candidatus Poribacteria bacterium]|nr:MAG: hypothetical protein KatS3mg115_1651 [Candidatus Poribacteria bacterium]